MQLSQTTLAILKYMATINNSITIKKGKKIVSLSPNNTTIAYYDGDDEFTENLAIYDLNEFLSVLVAFQTPDLKFNTKDVVVSSGKSKVVYAYTDESLLQKIPDKTPNHQPVVEFSMSETVLQSIMKMSAILKVTDLTIVGDGSKIVAKVYDAKNPNSKSFEVDLDSPTTETFAANFKLDKLMLFSGDYSVDISKKKFARFINTKHQLTVFVTLETSSEI